MAHRAVVISGDTHLGSNHTDFLPYFEPQYQPAYRDFLEMAELAAQVQAKRAAEEAQQPSSGDAMSRMMSAAPGRMLDLLLDRNNDGSVPYSPEYIANMQKERRELIASLGYEEFDENEFMTVLGEGDPDLRLKMLEADGQVGQVLYPQIGFLLTSTGPELKWAGIRAFNAYAAEFAAHHPDRYAATFMVDFDDVGRAVEEAHFAAERGMRGGAFISGGRPHGKPALCDPYYDPFFDALEELNLPFNMHGAFGGSGDSGWVAGPGAAIFNEVWISYNNMSKGGPLMHFLCGGVFERHPKLQIVVAETGGLYWAASVLETLDEIYHAKRPRAPMSLRTMNPRTVEMYREFPRAPSDYFRTNCFVQGHNSLMDWGALEKVGVDNVIWSSDFAHAESTWPHSMKEIAFLMKEKGVSVEIARKFLGENAARLYNFDLGKLQPVADRVGPELEQMAEVA